MESAMEKLGLYIVIVFFAAQFIALFKYTNLGLVLAVKGDLSTAPVPGSLKKPHSGAMVSANRPTNAKSEASDQYNPFFSMAVMGASIFFWFSARNGSPASPGS